MTAFSRFIFAALAIAALASPVSAQKITGGSGGGSGTVTSVTCAATVITSSGTCYSAGQVVGTATNNNATAGNFGEFVESSIPVGSAVGLTSGAAANVTSVSLTGGDWWCAGNVIFSPNAATTIVTVEGWITLTSAAAPTRPNGGAYFRLQQNLAPGTGEVSWTLAPFRVSIAGTTTVYLGALSAFVTNTNSVYGYIGCRRAR